MRKSWILALILGLAALGPSPASAQPKDIVDTAVAAGSFKTLAKLLADADLVEVDGVRGRAHGRRKLRPAWRPLCLVDPPAVHGSPRLVVGACFAALTVPVGSAVLVGQAVGD